MEEVAEVTSGINRRDFVKRSAIVGGLVWAAPVINSFAAPAFAGTHDTTDLCPDGTGQPTDLRWRYYHEADPCNRPAGENLQTTDTCYVIDDPLVEYPNGVENLVVKLTGASNPEFNYTVTLDEGKTFTFEVPGKAGAWQRLSVFNADGVLLHEVYLHTSCSEPLRIGDRFGNFELVGGF